MSPGLITTEIEEAAEVVYFVLVITEDTTKEVDSITSVVSRVRGRETSIVQGRDARLVAMDCKRSRRSGAGSDEPKREGNTPNSPRRAVIAQKQQTQAL